MGNTDLSDAVNDATESEVGEEDKESSTDFAVVVVKQRKKAYANCDKSGQRF